MPKKKISKTAAKRELRSSKTLSSNPPQPEPAKTAEVVPQNDKKPEIVFRPSTSSTGIASSVHAAVSQTNKILASEVLSDEKTNTIDIKDSSSQPQGNLKNPWVEVVSKKKKNVDNDTDRKKSPVSTESRNTVVGDDVVARV